jgi:hypothetical protein
LTTDNQKPDVNAVASFIWFFVLTTACLFARF